MEKRRMKGQRIHLIVAMTLLFFVAGGLHAAIAADTIKIGLLEPTSGPFEFASRVYGSALQFVVDEYNANGGLLGKKIEVILEDSEMKPDVAVRKAKRLILQDKVNFLSANTGSHLALAMGRVATTYKTLFFNVGSASDTVMGKGFSRYAFRLAANVTDMSTSLALGIARTKYRKLYVICQDFVAGHDFVESFKKQVSIHVPDAEIVGETYHPFAVKDFAPYISKVKMSKADAVVTTNWGTDLINLVNQARSLGLKQPFPFIMVYGSDPTHLYGMKENAVGGYFVHSYSMRVQTPENQAMIRKYHEKHKNDKDFLTWWPAGNVGQAIIGWKMIFAAVEKAGSLDADKIIDAFEGFWYESPVGWWTMRKCDHQAIMPMFWGQIMPDKNPYFNGSIREEIEFPFVGPDLLTLPSMVVALPPTSDYNPRCP